MKLRLVRRTVRQDGANRPMQDAEVPVPLRQVVAAVQHVGEKLGARRRIRQDDEDHAPEYEVHRIVGVAAAPVVAIAEMPQCLQQAWRLLRIGQKACLLLPLGGQTRIFAGLGKRLQPRLQRFHILRFTARQGACLVEAEQEEQRMPPRHRARQVDHRQKPAIGLDQKRHFPVCDGRRLAAAPHEMKVEGDALVRPGHSVRLGRQRADAMMVLRPETSGGYCILGGEKALISPVVSLAVMSSSG